MSRIPVPSSPSRRRSSARRHRALWVLLIGGVGAAVAGRGRVMALLGRGSEDDLYAGASVSSTEGPAVAAAQTEVDDIAHEEVPPSFDPEGEAEPDDAASESVGEPASAPDDLPPVAGDEIDPTLSATEVADPAAVVDPGEAAAVVEPDPEAPADMPDAAPLDAPPLADDTDEDPLAIEEADKAAAEAGAIGSEPEDPDRP